VQFEVLGNNLQNHPVATITWTVNGNSTRRVIDVLNGMTISGAAEFIQVKVVDTSLSDSAVPYTVAALVTPGARATGPNPPTLSEFLVSVGPAGSNTVAVPLDAGITSVWVLVGPDDPTDSLDPTKIVVTQQDATGTILRIYTEPNSLGFVPLFPAATVIKIWNNSADDASATVIFGVDG
jgi:hypothetical protein